MPMCLTISDSVGCTCWSTLPSILWASLEALTDDIWAKSVYFVENVCCLQDLKRPLGDYTSFFVERDVKCLFIWIVCSETSLTTSVVTVCGLKVSVPFETHIKTSSLLWQCWEEGSNGKWLSHRGATFMNALIGYKKSLCEWVCSVFWFSSSEDTTFFLYGGHRIKCHVDSRE